ncbi:MAG: sigma-54-dependent Fis family transcriptional regulator, partial [Desulfobacteraceae bacterium]
MLLRVVCAIDEKKIKTEIEKWLSELDVQVKFSHSRDEAWHELTRSCADIFIISKPLIPKPVVSNINILNALPEKPLTIVLHDSESSEEHANLLASGVDVVLDSGIPMESLCEAIESTIESRRQFNYSTRFDQRGRFQPKLSDFISNSSEMQFFLNELQQVVASDSTLLILGETGVGKEHLSKAIHAESPRSKGPFVALNMAAIPEQLMESELFGHEKGSFTGAVRSRRGAFEMAHQGTLCLDEIGEMPLRMQTKLLRVLQDMEF